MLPPPQAHLVFATFDVTTEQRSAVRDLLRTWSLHAARMSEGQLIGGNLTNSKLPPDDNGETLGLPSANLTITIGFGPTLFIRDGVDRFGLAGQRPSSLTDIPPMQRDALQAERSGGDLCIQACADDPQVAFHAIRNLSRAARGVAVVRWMQRGFMSLPTNAKGDAETPRNLFGFKDGTANINTNDNTLMNRSVWVNSSEQPAWMRNGTYLVARRIRMFTEVWDRSSLDDQQKTLGREKLSGAPFGEKDEFASVNFNALPQDSHVRLARGDGQIQILRRGYSYIDGIDPKTGELDVGLFFISFQRDIQQQFIPMLSRLAASDALNEYISHTSSAVFACPPGTNKDGYVGETLFASM